MEKILTLLHSRILIRRVGRGTLWSGEWGGGRRRWMTSSLVHLTRFDHPSHLALGFWRAILDWGNNLMHHLRNHFKKKRKEKKIT